MRKIKVYRLGDDSYVTYEVPSRREAIAHAEDTFGRQFDRIERKHVEGGLPQLWPKWLEITKSERPE